MNSAEFVAHFRRTFPDLVAGSALVALSGGRDSVALLHLLRDPRLELTLEAAHVHHGLRGTEADDDATFCDRLCRTLGIPFATLRMARDHERPATGEAAWRRQRYRSLLTHAADRGIGAIATGHHGDDVAEGILLQILRGAGPRAMAGIAEETSQGVIRPLLPWGRHEIDAWLGEHHIVWRDDSSNSDLGRLRNRVRHVILPGLENDAPRLRRHLVSLAAALAEDESFMAGELRRRVGFADPWDPAGGVDLELIEALPRALRARWLHGQMERLGVGSVTRRQLALFHDLLDTGSPRAVTMAARWRIRAARRRLWAEPPTPPTGRFATLAMGDTVPLGIPGWRVRLTETDARCSDVRWSWRPSTPDGSITFRPADERDLLSDGAGGSRSARRLLAEFLPRHLRAAWPVFCENDMIYWIPGAWQHPETGDPRDRVVEVIRP